MRSFNNFLISESTVNDLKNEIRKLGYNKIEDRTKTMIAVYVPKSDRNFVIDKLASDLKGAGRDTSTESLRKGGSLGLVKFNAGPFQDLNIAVKPDSSKDLTTDEHESLSAYMTALKFKNPETDFTLDDFTSLPVQSKFSAKQLLDKAGEGWMKSSILHAERLHRTFGRGKYIFCQRSRSKFVDKISLTANTLLKKAGHSIGLDKWNPADIWMVDPSLINMDFSHFDSIHMLNTFLYDQYTKKKLIGVSLKQAKRSAKAQVFNYRLGQKPVSLDSMNLGKTGFTKSIDGFIFYNRNSSVVLRSFKPTADISGEINGKYAQGGKVGFGPLNRIIGECVPRTRLTKNTEILKSYKRNPDQYLSKLYNEAKTIDKRLSSMNMDTFKKEIMGKGAKTLPYIVSKTQVTEVVGALQKASKQKIECAISKMISYAASSTEVSSVFVKVS